MVSISDSRFSFQILTFLHLVASAPLSLTDSNGRRWNPERIRRNFVRIRATFRSNSAQDNHRWGGKLDLANLLPSVVVQLTHCCLIKKLTHCCRLFSDRPPCPVRPEEKDHTLALWRSDIEIKNQPCFYLLLFLNTKCVQAYDTIRYELHQRIMLS